MSKIKLTAFLKFLNNIFTIKLLEKSSKTNKVFFLHESFKINNIYNQIKSSNLR